MAPFPSLPAPGALLRSVLGACLVTAIGACAKPGAGGSARHPAAATESAQASAGSESTEAARTFENPEWMPGGSEGIFEPIAFDEPSVAAGEAIYGHYLADEDYEDIDLLGGLPGAPGIYLVALTMTEEAWREQQDGVVPPPFPYELGFLRAVRVEGGAVIEVRSITGIAAESIDTGFMGDPDGDGAPELVFRLPRHSHDFEGDDADPDTYGTQTWAEVAIVDASLRQQGSWMIEATDDGMYKEARAELRDLNGDGRSDICVEERAATEACAADVRWEAEIPADGETPGCTVETSRSPMVYRADDDAWRALGRSAAPLPSCS